MTALRGVVTDAGVFVEANGRRVELPPTLTPLGEALRELLTAGVEPCPVCDRYACDCDEWMHHIAAANNADPHGDLSVFTSWDIPF